jgi:DNA-binding transcriptional MerR regulator
MQLFLTTGEAGRALGGVTAASVRRLEREGRLRLAATTPSGIRLFSPKEVRRLARQRTKRRRRNQRNG